MKNTEIYVGGKKLYEQLAKFTVILSEYRRELQQSSKVLDEAVTPKMKQLVSLLSNNVEVIDTYFNKCVEALDKYTEWVVKHETTPSGFSNDMELIISRIALLDVEDRKKILKAIKVTIKK